MSGEHTHEFNHAHMEYVTRAEWDAFRLLYNSHVAWAAEHSHPHEHETATPESPQEPQEAAVGFGVYALGGTATSYPETNSELREALLTPGVKIYLPPNKDLSVGSVTVAKDLSIIGQSGSSLSSSMLHLTQDNFVARNFTLKSAPGSGYDLIRNNGASHYWLDHLTFEQTGDEQLDLFAWPNPENDPGEGTVSYCHFKPAWAAILIGERQDMPTPGAERTKVSLYRNYFQTRYRVPNVKYAIVDGWNNYAHGWVSSARELGEEGHYRSAGDIFRAPAGNHRTMYISSSYKNSLQIRDGLYLPSIYGDACNPGAVEDIGVFPTASYAREYVMPSVELSTQIMEEAGAS